MVAIAFALAVLVLGAVTETLSMRRDLSRLDVGLAAEPALVEAGGTVVLTLTLRNASRLPLSFVRWRVPLPEGLVPCDEGQACPGDGAAGADDGPADGVAGNGTTGDASPRAESSPPRPVRRELAGTAWLAGGQTLRRTARVRVERRGTFWLRDATVYGGDFLGVADHPRDVELACELVAYPRRSANAALERAASGLVGDVSVRRFVFEDPVLTAGVREYTGREPLRAVNWKQSARAGRLMANVYDHTAQAQASVLVNVAPRRGDDTLPVGTRGDVGRAWRSWARSRREGEDVEACLEAARTLCEALERRGVTYDLRTNAQAAGLVDAGSRVPEGLGSLHFRAALERLGRVTSVPAQGCAEMVQRAARAAAARGGGSSLVLVTPPLDAGARAGLERSCSALGCELRVMEASSRQSIDAEGAGAPACPRESPPRPGETVGAA